jgi:glyoxylase-like metal-dependent hydrolase (beta-lactamase superfamily II)
VAVDVIVTVPWHERSAGLILERYGKKVGCRVWAHEHAVERLGCPVTNPFGEKARLPGGIQSLEVERAGEVVLWLAQPRALVVGDALLGRGGGLRLCPADWVGGESNLARIRASLESARDLPIEMVLVSHGPPVMTGGQKALADALDAQR